MNTENASHYTWRILLIDDDEEDHILIRALLSAARQDKFLLEWAYTYQQGLEALHSDQYDAVLVDYELGKLKGIDLIREAVSEGYAAPMILITGQGSYDVDVMAMQNGAADYMNKNELNAGYLERSIRYAIERKRSQAALQESDTRFRVALSAVPIFVFTMDRDLRYTWVHNPQYGFTAENMVGKRDDELFPAEMAERYIQMKCAVIESGRGIQQEVFENLNGEEVYFFVTLEPTLDAQGKVTGLTGTTLDVTQQRRLEAQQADFALQMEVQRRLLEQREMERLNIARDLHDGPLQELTAVSFGIHDAMAQDQKEARLARLTAVQAQLVKQLHELRVFCNDLRPPTLAPFGLEKAIRSHADTFEERHPSILLHLNLAPDGQILPENTRMAFFRIYQESLNNIAKHSRAKNVWITLQVEPDSVSLEIVDDGVGFEVPEDWIQQARSGHLGLVGMRERAAAVDAQLDFDSKLGMGAVIRIATRDLNIN